MKKICFLIFLNLLFIPFYVHASGSINVSSNELNMKVGERKTFKIVANNAAGRVDISSSDSSIVTISKSSIFLDMNSDTITVTAKKAGKATVNVILTDIATYDSETLSGTKVINITVNDAASTSNTSKNTSNVSKKNNTIINEKNADVVKEEPKEISITKFDIVGYDIDFNKDVYNYNISVDKNVSKIYVIVEGNNFIVENDKEIDVRDVDVVTVTLKGETETKEYKININRINQEEIKCDENDSKENNKCEENKIILYAMIFFELLSFVLLLVLIKLKRRNSNV